ncbi:hypothetical protein VCHA50P415_40174 [Vibrio chagasii]|nr:hypothetical protein VCHA34P131_20405 [Vibrio chagasii]CAH6939735.1 hypothetical protein VCHA39O220_140022 [Vibrio chagasii]CAH6994112.1 hypothetical protein VCHA37P193_190029 [Vibrio chagasii]CAH7185310.1 hypothetical protein VCHA39O224_130097 [Vibrio chagasii]CAH7249134.1 hypothetical protein VCHA50P415_40174 [Vibrio chagasii]
MLSYTSTSASVRLFLNSLYSNKLKVITTLDVNHIIKRNYLKLCVKSYVSS